MRRAALEVVAGTAPSQAMAVTKLVRVLAPRNALAAASQPQGAQTVNQTLSEFHRNERVKLREHIPLSYALAPSSAESNVPSHSRIFCVVSLISATHRPEGRCRTPTNRFLLLGSNSLASPAPDNASKGTMRKGAGCIVLQQQQRQATDLGVCWKSLTSRLQ